MVSKHSDSKRPRQGRPPKDLAGDVKARILDAAQRVFLKKGYQGASLDEIAEVAPEQGRRAVLNGRRVEVQ